VVAKILGLASGALIASIGVWVFNEWRHLSDEDRLKAVLKDHCLPYVENGTRPFDDMGRIPGVYDTVDVNENIEDGGIRLVFDNRFLAQWGVALRDNISPDLVRICQVSPILATAGDIGFAVPDEGLIETVTAVIAPDGRLVADTETVPDGPRTIGWFEPDTDPTEGLRVILVAGGGVVSIVLTANDMP